MSRTKGGAGRQLSVVTIDQAISSASNILFLVLAAHVLTLSAFGVFSIVFGTYTLMVFVERALVSDPLLIHPEEGVRRPGAAVGASILVGLGLGAVAALVGGLAWVLGYPQVGHGLVVLGLCLPLLLLQDLGRFIGFATHRPGLAVWLDSVWLVLAVVGAVVLALVGESALWVFTATWGGAGAVAGLVLLLRVPDSSPSAQWLRDYWSYSRQYLGGTLAAQGSALLGTVVAGPLVGTRGLGALRAATLLSRPFGTFQIAAMSATIVQIARADAEAVVRRRLRQIAILVVGVAAVMSVVLLVLPDWAGTLVLGDTWRAAEPLLPPVCANMGVVAAMTPARAGLVGLKYVATATRVDIANAVLSISAALAGAAIGGVSGALWGVVAVAAPITALAWLALLRRLPRHWPANVTATHGADPTAV